MRKLIFPAESYTIKNSVLICDKAIVGVLELLWNGIEKSQAELSKKEHKVNKRLKESIELITRYKDKDEDSRVALEDKQELILEEDQYELLVKLLEGNKFTSLISKTVVALWDIVDNAETFTPLKAVPTDDRPKAID